MATNDDTMFKIMSSLGLNFTPAEDAIKSFESRIALLNAQLVNMKTAAISGAKDINQAFSSQLGKFDSVQNAKSVASSKVILDQYGNTLVEFGNKASKVKEQSEKLTAEQEKQSKTIRDLIGQYKAGAIDAQKFVQEASKFKVSEGQYNKLPSQLQKDQIALYPVLTKAEKEHTNVLKEIKKDNDAMSASLTKSKKETSESATAQSKYNKELAQLIQLYKTQQIDAQTFVNKASPFRTDTSTWNSLQAQEQVKLVNLLTSAEKEHTGVLAQQQKIQDAMVLGQVKLSELSKMQADVATAQSVISKNGLSEQYAAQATILRSQIGELETKLSLEGKLSNTELKQVEYLQEQLSILRQQTRTAVSDMPATSTNIFAQGFQRRAEWFLTGSLFFGVVNAAKEATKAISDVETGVTQVARVMEDSSFRFNGYRDSLLNFGVAYGQTFDSVQDIALRWAQAGYNVKDSLENTKVSLLALNSAELDSKQATEDMIGIMSQWQLTSADLPLLLDKINKTAWAA